MNLLSLKVNVSSYKLFSMSLILSELGLKNSLIYLEPLLKTTVTEKHQLERKLEESAFQLADRCEVVAELETRLTAEREAQAEKLKTLEQAKEQLKEEFQNLANRIFDEKLSAFLKRVKRISARCLIH